MYQKCVLEIMGINHLDVSHLKFVLNLLCHLLVSMWKAKNGIAFYHIIYLNTLKQNFWGVLNFNSEFQTTSKWSFK
jgi:hypothetical protein